MDSLSSYPSGEKPPFGLIHEQLAEAGLPIPSGELQLDPLSSNPNRHDYLTRKNFRVISGGKIICLLTIGKDLEQIWRRAVAFATACPNITCRPLFFFSFEGLEHFGIEFFDGRDLESLVKDNQISTQEALQCATRIVAKLEETSQPSTFEDAAKEIDALFEQVCVLPLFTGFDQVFLKRIVFPFVRDRALSGTLRTRWSNGDLIARNVLVDAQKNVRLIDYEFAFRTHFFEEDAWRWRTFSELPPVARDLPCFSKEAECELWREAFYLLHQLVMAYETNGAAMAIPDSQPALIRLREIATIAHSGFRNSIFLKPLGTLSDLESVLRETQQKINRLEQEKQTLEKSLHHQELESEKLAQTLLQRDGKLHYIQQTLSWRSTFWLRTLGRSLPFFKPPKFHFHLDTPRVWRPYGVTDIRGWCFAKSTFPINEVRVQIGRRIFTGVYSMERGDVGREYPQHPQAYRCGFHVQVEILQGDEALELSVSDGLDRWHVVYRANLKEDPQPVKGSYVHWVKTFDTLTAGDLTEIRTEIAALTKQPLVSIIMPVYNTPETYLIKAIASVRNQVYENWELCIADDTSSAPHVKPLLERLAREDSRIKLAFRHTNGHIAASSNTALALATGEYVALCDHDDELRPHALAEVVKAINRHPDLQLIYTDEDKLDAHGNRFDPYFKPDWMHDLLIGHNYLCHFSVFRADTIRALGGWRTGFDGAQDWDLQLRIVEKAQPLQIVHIPKILYHWRAITGSTALNAGEKDYVVEAARRAITDHFERVNQRVQLIHQPGNHWRAKYSLPQPVPLVSLIIPTKNGLKYLKRCVESVLEKTSYRNYEIIIVDNDSDDPATLDYLNSDIVSQPGLVSPTPDQKVRVLSYPHSFNYSAINNFAVREAKGEFVGLLNNDLEVISSDWLDELVSHAARPEIGCVGPMLYYPNNTLQHAGVVVGIAGHAGHAFKGFPKGHPGYMNHARLVKNYSAVTGACLVVRKSTYEQAGGLDEKNLGISLNDVDLCLRVRNLGYRNLWTPFAELYHHESASRGYEDSPEKLARFALERETFRQRWMPIIANDPAYNPNLTQETEDFAFAYPPRG